MQNKWVINILLVIIMILVVIACVVAYMCFTNDVEIIAKQQEDAIFTVENYPKVNCATSLLPLAEAFKANFTKTDIKDIEIEHSKTYDLYKKLINNEVDLILVTDLTEEEQKLIKDIDVELESFCVAKDAFVFFVNKSNPIDNLTLGQIQSIYSGKIKNWTDVGGEEGNIIAYQRPDNSRSQKGMEELIMQEIKMMPPLTESVFHNKSNVLDVISDYNNEDTSIGYAYHYDAITMFTNKGIKLLSVNGIKPTYENIQTGLYDLQTEYYAVIRKDEPVNSNTRKLLEAYVSERGQNVAKEAGYVQNY